MLFIIYTVIPKKVLQKTRINQFFKSSKTNTIIFLPDEGNSTRYAGRTVFKVNNIIIAVHR